ncbi:MAG: high-affinity branched-chain amino acid ABC transporter permease LivM [Pseudomonas sp.]|jgi:branched-chain amino acid transport system permease protein|nr:high-affinity branched-chain amino acid ABC transporter permease LivM [Pseudomonas sp.]MDD2223089.1 high-affinity branched-chain amino acid ABC transporter permease LivM [Pseudomonas sp.]MDY0414914.1 high-affinity branched-chain amino acid ABC transporter permease LivM [Pseudomonas sp.]NLO54833.1 high-affinity branched-chain amino acid ABC transporter permease LivM [Gammaproteobacteria bacterium]
MRLYFKSAIFSAIIVLVLSAILLGVRLTQVGTALTLVGAEADVLWKIFAATALIFVYNLWRDPIERFLGYIPTPSLSVGLRNLSQTQVVQRLLWCFLIATALIFPFLGSRSQIDLATLVLIYVMLGLGLNIVVGLAGLLDLGYVGFYAVGAYTYAMLAMYFGVGFWTGLIAAGVMAAFFGFILGFPVLRLRGDYLAIVTLGFGEIIRIMLNNLTALTGGPRGIGNIPKPTLFNLEFSRRASEGSQSFHEYFGIAFNSNHRVIFLYLLALVLVLITVFVINRLIRMPIGRAWEAMREDEIACRALGMNPTQIKLSAFTIGATFAGFAGSFFAARQGFISPESFTFIESAIILAIVVLGGMGSQIGVILAAIVMTVLPEMAREFNEYRMLLFGLMMVLMMIWRPQGLLPMKRPHLELPQ